VGILSANLVGLNESGILDLEYCTKLVYWAQMAAELTGSKNLM